MVINVSKCCVYAHRIPGETNILYVGSGPAARAFVRNRGYSWTKRVLESGGYIEVDILWEFDSVREARECEDEIIFRERPECNILIRKSKFVSEKMEESERRVVSRLEEKAAALKIRNDAMKKLQNEYEEKMLSREGSLTREGAIDQCRKFLLQEYEDSSNFKDRIIKSEVHEKYSKWCREEKIVQLANERLLNAVMRAVFAPREMIMVNPNDTSRRVKAWAGLTCKN